MIPTLLLALALPCAAMSDATNGTSLPAVLLTTSAGQTYMGCRAENVNGNVWACSQTLLTTEVPAVTATMVACGVPEYNAATPTEWSYEIKPGTLTTQPMVWLYRNRL